MNRMAALHQAAHCVVGAALGARITSVTLNRDGTGRFEYDPSVPMATVHHVAMHAAGGMAEGLYGRSNEMVFRTMGIGEDIPYSDDLDAVNIKRVTSDRMLIRGGVRIAATILNYEWEALESLARALRRWEQMDERDLAACLPERGSHLGRVTLARTSTSSMKRGAHGVRRKKVYL